MYMIRPHRCQNYRWGICFYLYIYFPAYLYRSAIKKIGEIDCPCNFYLDHHYPAPNNIITFYRRHTDSPGTGDKIGIALFYQEHSYAGWVHKYKLQHFNARCILERSLSHHIYS